MTNIKYDDSIASAAFVYERFDQHEQDHGQPVRNDPEIWRDVDFNSTDTDRAKHWVRNLMSLAKFHKHWSPDLEAWCGEVLRRDPAYLRQRGDKWTTNDNNLMIWKLMMLFREVVRQELDMMELNTFDELFDPKDA